MNLAMFVQPAILVLLGVIGVSGVVLLRPWRWFQRGVPAPAGSVLDVDLLRDIVRDAVAEQSARSAVQEERVVNVKSVLDWVRKHVFTFRTLYWGVNLVVMAYSAQNGGHLFGLYESVGIILPLIFDALIVVFTQAMLAAKSRGDMWRTVQIFLFILLCTTINLIANVYASLDKNVTFADKIWIAPILPYVVSCMPVFLACLALIADTVGMAVIKKPTEEEMVYSRYDPAQWQKRQMAKLKIRAMRVRAKELSAMIDSREKLIKVIQKKERRESYRKTPVAELHVQLQKLDTVIASVLDGKMELTVSILPADQVEEKAEKSAVLTGDNTVELEDNSESISADQNSGTVSRQNGALPSASSTANTDGDVDDWQEPNESSKNANPTALDLSALNLSPDVLAVVKRYPAVYASWLSKDVKSVTIPEIVEATNLSKRRVQFQIGKALKTTPRNDQRVYVTSVIDWLKTLPVATVSSQSSANDQAEKETDALPRVESNQPFTSDQNSEKVSLQNSDTVNEYYADMSPTNDDEMDRLAVTLSAMRQQPEISNAELAEILGLTHVESALFWRLQARRVLEQDQQIVEQSTELASA